MIYKNLEKIKYNIQKACEKTCKNAEDITIIGVTKTINVGDMEKLKNAGIHNFGENKAQELVQKYNQIDDISWHFIGNLQTNKVRHIIDKVSLIHSVNSIKLINEINKRAFDINKNMEILLEINVAEDMAKNGIYIKDLSKILDEIKKFSNITLVGLMCIAPFVEDGEKNRQFFIKMRKLFVDIEQKNNDNISMGYLSNIRMKYLSMGMTNDYIVAIEEGANVVRLGRAIFS